MKNGLSQAMKNVMKFTWPFLIGIVAGSSPFLCMTYLPSLLTSGAASRTVDSVALLVVSVLVGLVTGIVFYGEVGAEHPSKIFTKALGIPALLLATVTNTASKADLQRAQDTATLQVLSEPAAAEETPEAPTELSPPTESPEKTSSFSMTSDAWAQTATIARASASTPRDARFLLVLGQYTTEKEAWAAYNRWQPTGQFATERYYPKNIKVFAAGKTTFYVCYTGPLAAPDATRLLKVIRINDPNLSPKVVEQRGQARVRSRP